MIAVSSHRRTSYEKAGAARSFCRLFDARVDARVRCWTGSFTDPSSGTLCSPTPADQDQILFWDEVHPTAAGHLVAAEFALDALSAVPEAPTWAMLGIGFAGLGFASLLASRRSGRAAT